MRAFRRRETESIAIFPDLRDFRVLKRHAEALGLGAAELVQAYPGDARRKAEIVVVDLAVAPSPVAAIQDERAPAEPAHVDGGGEAGGAGSDDHAFPRPLLGSGRLPGSSHPPIIRVVQSVA
jgi:hypothetical protein